MYRNTGFFEQIGEGLVADNAVGRAVGVAILARGQRNTHPEPVKQGDERCETEREHDHDCRPPEGIGLDAHPLPALRHVSFKAKPA